MNGNIMQLKQNGAVHSQFLTRVLAQGGDRLEGLDGLRAVCVFTVIGQHLGQNSPIPGSLGVSCFFVLSGFLITYLMLKEYAETGALSIPAFYARRALRIFPAYYVFIALTFLIAYVRHGAWPISLSVTALTYTVNYYIATEHIASGIAHAWSLAVEEQFYLLWPIAVLLLLPKGRQAMVGWLVTAIVGVMLWRSWLTLTYPERQLWAYHAFDTRADSLAMGCLLAAVAETTRFSRFAAVVTRAAWQPLVTLALLLASYFGLSQAARYAVGFTIEAALLTLLLVQVLALCRTPLWSWLRWRPVVAIGVISYPIYLYHSIAISSAMHLPLDNIWLRRFIGVMIAMSAAAASYWIIERPFLKIKSRFQRQQAHT